MFAILLKALGVITFVGIAAFAALYGIGHSDKVVDPVAEQWHKTKAWLGFSSHKPPPDHKLAARLLLTLQVARKSGPPYDRNEWAPWADTDGDCRDTRAEVLIRDSEVPVTTRHNGCRVSAGQWTDPWSGETYTSADNVDVDHHVPLANAHASGGHAWDRQQKAAFYNDLDYPWALNAMLNVDNQEKSAKGPESWRPRNRDAYCNYAAAWVIIKQKYQLTVTEAERENLRKMLITC